LEHGRVSDAIPVVELLRKDSLEMSQGDRAIIRDAVASSDAARIILTHGTDTMVDTAHALKGIPGKTIVLTGALQPGRFADSDAPFNLGMAVAAVQALPPGVYLAANGKVSLRIACARTPHSTASRNSTSHEHVRRARRLGVEDAPRLVTRVKNATSAALQHYGRTKIAVATSTSSKQTPP
jgi:L-asparaginase/Glu-tRNA(Gln) amidotransferase subunit D